MVSSRNRLPPYGFQGFFSLGIGLVTPRFIHEHEVGMFLATQVLWVLSMLFISMRAKGGGGKFLETEASLYLGISVPAYVVGLLFAGWYYAALG